MGGLNGRRIRRGIGLTIATGLFFLILWSVNHSFYKVSTPSMSATLTVGDVITTCKSCIGLRVGNSRLPGWQKPNFGDIVVFNNPEGDTIFENLVAYNYYQLIRDHGHERMADPNHKILTITSDGLAKVSAGRIIPRRLEEREVFVSRCMGMPGDTIEISHGLILRNGYVQPYPENVKYDHVVLVDRMLPNVRFAKLIGESEDSIYQPTDSTYQVPMHPDSHKYVASLSFVKRIERYEIPFKDSHSQFNLPYFPHHDSYNWTPDNLGPLVIPRKGYPISLSKENLPVYKRILEVNENRSVGIWNDQVTIDGMLVSSYSFAQDYYWVVSDNRHRAVDSRFFGFVPFDHMLGTSGFVVYHWNQGDGYFWRRLLRKVK